jgi:hypothetical protein
MKRSSLTALVVLLLAFSAISAFAQDPDVEGLTRPRTVFPVRPQAVANPQTSTGAKGPNIVTGQGPSAEESARPVNPGGLRGSEQSPAAKELTFLTPQLIRSRITEAERLLKSHPKQTALASPSSPSTDFVTIAALERSTGRVHLVNLTKETFLTKDSELTLPSSLGTQLSIRVLRANGVNTAVTVFDSAGQSLIPLVVEFPIEKGGVFREMAYYTSAHPALLSPDLTMAGRGYVRNMLDLAAKRLREKGQFISPQIVDIAERLCLVEHVDHGRFRLENRLALYDEVFSLYALNELDTYRYSVSFAGAGGMVQMIPWAYNLMRQRHPRAGLIPDFVVGMRNHGNALQAMLLYMHDTWSDLSANEDVQSALNGKLATQPELLAAGYNSNAAKLPGYIRRGGASWRTLIPRETQVYLQIYKSVEGLVSMKPRTAATLQVGN